MATGFNSSWLYDNTRCHPGPSGEEFMAGRWFDAISQHCPSTSLPLEPEPEPESESEPEPERVNPMTSIALAAGSTTQQESETSPQGRRQQGGRDSSTALVVSKVLTAIVGLIILMCVLHALLQFCFLVQCANDRPIGFV